jgi:hypothetical protein
MDSVRTEFINRPVYCLFLFLTSLLASLQATAFPSRLARTRPHTSTTRTAVLGSLPSSFSPRRVARLLRRKRSCRRAPSRRSTDLRPPGREPARLSLSSWPAPGARFACGDAVAVWGAPPPACRRLLRGRQSGGKPQFSCCD